LKDTYNLEDKVIFRGASVDSNMQYDTIVADSKTNQEEMEVANSSTTNRPKHITSRLIYLKEFV